MDKYLISVFNLESNPNHMTPIDTFKLFRNFDDFVSAMRDYASNNSLTNVEQFYFDIQIDPRRKFFYRLSQTYWNNYFLSIHFILSNPILITKPTFTNLYNQKHLLPEITNHIIDLYQTIDSQSQRFFNQILLGKFIANLDFQPISDDLTTPEYNEYFQLFIQETTRLKEYLIELIKDPKWAGHPEQGLSEFDPQYFRFAFEYHTGLKLDPSIDFQQIKNWAQKHLDYLMEEVNRTCDCLLIDPQDKQKPIYDKMILVGQDQSQRWLSKQDMIDAHELCISKYRRVFIAQHQFKEFNPPGLVVLDNPLLAAGYYNKDNFYLNVFRWDNGSSKYEIETLTLHEAIPGHHLQFNISQHSPYHNHLTTLDCAPCNGFTEGWALFAEHLGDSTFNDPWNYFGYLQSNIFRVFRIIAEILLHVEGQTPEQVIQLAKRYLTTSEAWIRSEVYRYRISPGQACSYKIGLEVFKRIIKHKFNVTQPQHFLRSDLLDWYKQILWNTERPLEVFLKENDVTWTFDD